MEGLENVFEFLCICIVVVLVLFFLNCCVWEKLVVKVVIGVICFVLLVVCGMMFKCGLFRGLVIRVVVRFVNMFVVKISFMMGVLKMGYWGEGIVLMRYVFF